MTRFWRYFLTTWLILVSWCPPLSAQTDHRKIAFPEDFSDDSPIPEQEVSEGWIALFDGQTLFGWRAESDANWHVASGEIVVNDGTPGLLRTSSQFDDFELLVEFACDATADSGILVRTSPEPTTTADGAEINIASPRDPFPTGSLSGRHRVESTPKPGEFNQLYIVAEQGRLRIRLNDELVLENTDQIQPRRGYIGLQFMSGEVRFRKVWLKPLSHQPLFNHSNLDGWQGSGENSFQVTVNEVGDMVLNGGPGYVESNASFGNFVLQIKGRISAGGNSGVFFRCLPGENANGYESQIDNGFRDGNRNSPSNGGTGGVFRRKSARSVVADDDAWFAKTIVVEGPHVAVWVNGYQVTDWSDRRKPDRNPRRGLSKEPGSIMLQGHDKSTTVLFREIQVHELAPRR